FDSAEWRPRGPPRSPRCARVRSLVADRWAAARPCGADRPRWRDAFDRPARRKSAFRPTSATRCPAPMLATRARPIPRQGRPYPAKTCSRPSSAEPLPHQASPRRPQPPRLVRNSTDGKRRGLTRPSQQCNMPIEAPPGHRRTLGATVLRDQATRHGCGQSKTRGSCSPGRGLVRPHGTSIFCPGDGQRPYCRDNLDRSPDMSPNPVLASVDARGVASIVFNRPEVGNAYDGELIAALLAAIADLAGRGGLRAVRLSGSGRHFQAGAHLNRGRGVAAGPPPGKPAATQGTAEALGGPHPPRLPPPGPGQ